MWRNKHLSVREEARSLTKEDGQVHDINMQRILPHKLAVLQASLAGVHHANVVCGKRLMFWTMIVTPPDSPKYCHVENSS